MTRLDELSKLLAETMPWPEQDPVAYVPVERGTLWSLLAVAWAAANLPDWLPEDAHVGIQAVKDNAGEIWIEIVRLRADLAPLLQEAPHDPD